MIKVIIGWVVRTETAGRHQYWQVGEVNPYRAAEIARDIANASLARAVSSLPTFELPKFQPAPGTISEIVWETRPVAGPFQLPVLEGQTWGSGPKGEVTFDIIVPEEGVKVCVEGCYRIDGGNWQVYVFARQGWARCAPHIWPDAVFSSGITGVDGVVPDNWVLNKKTVMGMLAVALGIEEWTELIGPDSLILK